MIACMNSPDITSTLNYAKSLSAKAPKSELLGLVGDLISCVDYLLQELKIKEEKARNLSHEAFGNKSEDISKFSSDNESEPTKPDAEENVNSVMPEVDNSEEIKDQINQLKSEINRLSGSLVKKSEVKIDRLVEFSKDD